MTYATVVDVREALGRSAVSVAPEQSAQWQRWLGTVERSIVALFRKNGLDLAAAIASGEPTAEDVADVEVAAAVRKAQNPVWARTSETKVLDDGQLTSRREDDLALLDPLDLLPSEVTRLLPGESAEASAPAYTVRPTFTPDCHIPGGW